MDLLAQNVGAVRIQCWNYSQESICFSEGKFFGTRSNETGAEEYTIPASNAFGLPHSFLSVSPAAVCQGESLKPSENGKGESNNVEVYLWSISRWHYRSSVDVPVAD